MKGLIAVSLIIVAILALVLITHKAQQNSITGQNSNTTIKQNSSVIAINSSAVPSEGIYLLRNSSIVYIVYYKPITGIKIFNYTFDIAGPLSTFNGVLELQNSNVYQKLQSQKEVTVEIYNGSKWENITLEVMYTSQSLKPYAFLVPSGEVIPFLKVCTH